jgi:hypothetical protein
MERTDCGRAARVLVAAISLCAFTLCGCSGGGVGVVSGKVTFNNKSLAMGQVIVVGVDSMPYYGIIEDDGTYKVTGVPAGPAKVAVSSTDPRNTGRASRPAPDGGGPPRPGMGNGTPLGDPKKWFPIPEKYLDFNASGITLTVERGENPFNIDLK